MKNHNFLLTMPGLGAMLSLMFGLAATTLTAYALYRMPYYPAIWLAMTITPVATFAALAYLVSGVRRGRRQE